MKSHKIKATGTNCSNAISSETRRKLKASMDETSILTMREIHCAYCGFLVEKVFSDVSGHKMVYCRKCKTEYPVNLEYFRGIRKREKSHTIFAKR